MKVATPILTWQESSGNGHNQLPGSKSKQNSNNILTDQTKTYQNPSKIDQKHDTPNRTIMRLIKPCKNMQI